VTLILDWFLSFEDWSHQVLIVNALIGNLSWFIYSEKHRPSFESIFLGSIFGVLVTMVALENKLKEKMV